MKKNTINMRQRLLSAIFAGQQTLCFYAHYD